MRTLLSIVLFLISFTQLNAHAIWIETSTQAKVGDTHQVRIFFGEPNETNKPTPTQKWYSDLGELSLMLISPSGKTTELKKEQAEDYYFAHFQVTEEGVYKLEINHLVAKVYKRMRLRYQAVAFVSTSTENQITILGDKNFFQLQTNTFFQGNTFSYKAFYKKKPFKQKNITFDFSVDKSVSLPTDKKGEITFNTEEDTRPFVVNLAKKKKNRGKHNNRKHLFDYIWLTLYNSNNQ